MLRKHRKLLIRVSSLISSLVILVCCMAFPASASSISEDSQWFEVLDYTVLDPSSGNFFYFSDPYTARLPLPNTMTIYDIDIVLTATKDFTCSVSWGSTLYDLTVTSLGDRLYRVRGSLEGRNFNSLPINFTSTSSGTNYITLQRVRINSIQTSSFEDSAFFTVNNLSYKNYTPGSDVYYYWDSIDNPTGDRQFSSFIYLNNFVKYDYADVHFMVCASSIDSISCYLDDESIPFEVSYLASDGDSWYEYEYGELTADVRKFDICIRLDFSQLDPESSGSPCIEIRGLTPYDYSQCFVRLMEYTGYVITGNTNPLFYYFKDFKSFFTNLFKSTFGTGDSGASDAIQTQDQINTSINNQIVGAMEDWDTHIESVQVGSDTALTHAIPALSWLSGIADSIFNNMGWFSNIYILVGLLSAYFLILSKSGIAHKIGHITRRE